jgi:hypothetical protein
MKSQFLQRIIFYTLLKLVTLDLPDRGWSLASVVNRCLLTIRLTVECWWPTRWAICLSEEHNTLERLVRRNPFANSTVLKRQWLPHRLLSARTVRNRLISVGYRSRRPVKICLLTQAHKAPRAYSHMMHIPTPRPRLLRKEQFQQC